MTARKVCVDRFLVRPHRRAQEDRLSAFFYFSFLTRFLGLNFLTLSWLSLVVASLS